MTEPLPKKAAAQRATFMAAYRPLFNKVRKMQGSHIMMYVVADPEAPTDRICMSIFEGTQQELIEDRIENTTVAFPKDSDALEEFCANMLRFIAEDQKHYRRLIVHSIDLEIQKVNVSTNPPYVLH